jgi:hypothetical protein
VVSPVVSPVVRSPAITPTPPTHPHPHPHAFQFQILSTDHLLSPLSTLPDLETRLHKFTELVSQESWSIYRLKGVFKHHCQTNANTTNTTNTATIINWAFGKYTLHDIQQQQQPQQPAVVLFSANVIGMHLLVQATDECCPTARVWSLLERAFGVKFVHRQHQHRQQEHQHQQEQQEQEVSTNHNE